MSRPTSFSWNSAAGSQRRGTEGPQANQLRADSTAPANRWVDDPAELRRNLRDLVALTALPAIWLGQSPQVIVESFTDALLLAIALQGAELRAVQERQRLARDLHDSVSQALYAIVLDIATAQRIGAADPTRLEAILRDAHALAEAGLAEMRALIFELRPEFLRQEGLVAALQRQVAAVRARHQLSIVVNATDEPEAAPAIKEALYRVGQEALNNIAKHAGARAVVITLEESGAELVLRVRDDGRGFDAGKSFPGHLGLHSMRERAASVGGVILINSVPGQGTEVTIRVPRRKTR